MKEMQVLVVCQTMSDTYNAATERGLTRYALDSSTAKEAGMQRLRSLA